MTRLMLVGLLLCISLKVPSGEVQHAVVEFKDKSYILDVAVVIEGKKEAVYTIVTDYDQFYRLSSIFVETSVISSIDAEITRHQMLTRTCIFFSVLM